MAEASCSGCEHYSNHRTSGGSPPWRVCRWDLAPATCGRFSPRLRPLPSWDSPKDPTHAE